MRHSASFLPIVRSAFAILTVIVLIAGPALSQTETAEEKTAAEKEAEAVRASLQAIVSILDAQAAKRQAAEELRAAIEKAETDVDKKDLGEKLKAVNDELSQFDDQVVSLATGVSQNELRPVNEKFELQQELEQLIRPFVWILKSATENARQIEHLKRTLLAATQQEKTAADAVGPHQADD